MYDHLLRRAKQTVYQPLATRTPFTPNALTGLGLIAGLSAALLAALGLFRPALICWLANRFLDGLDGEVARAKESQSDLGGYLDILADLLVYAFIPAALAMYHQTSVTWFATVFILASFYLNVGSRHPRSHLLCSPPRLRPMSCSARTRTRGPTPLSLRLRLPLLTRSLQ